MALQLLAHAGYDDNSPVQTTFIKGLHDEKKGWHSRIKRAYRQHAGLSQRHKIQFLKWYSYFENQQKTNNP